MNADAAKKYSRQELLDLIEVGFKKLGVEAGQPAVAPLALLRALENEFELAEDRIHRSFELDRALAACKVTLVEHGIAEDYVPPRLLVRRALALMFAFHETIVELEKSADISIVDTAVFDHEALHLIHSSGSVAEIYQLPDEKVDKLLAVVRSRSF